MAIQQDNLVGFLAGDLVCMAQTDHMLGVLMAAFIAYTGLAHHEGLKSFLAQFGQNRAGRDVGIAV